jgi:hypothetical protein
LERIQFIKKNYYLVTFLINYYKKKLKNPQFGSISLIILHSKKQVSKSFLYLYIKKAKQIVAERDLPAALLFY